MVGVLRSEKYKNWEEKIFEKQGRLIFQNEKKNQPQIISLQENPHL